MPLRKKYQPIRLPLRKVVLALPLLFFVGCTEKSPSYSEYWLSWGNTQLTNWVSSANKLEADSQTFCQGELGLGELQNQILDLSLIRAGINGLPYHAIADLNLNFELYFWPDKRDMTRARLSQRLQSDAPLTEDFLAGATAAEKGLLAIEWIGFSENLTVEQRCSLLPAISSHYQNNVQKISEYHEENPLVMASWTQDSQSPEGKSIAINLLFQQLAYLSNSLRNSINTSNGQFVPILAQGWRMNASTKIFSTSLDSVIKHLQALAIRMDLTPETLESLQAHITALQSLSSELSSQDFDWRRLQQAIINAERVIEGPVAQEQNVVLGFSNFDGD